MTFVLSYLLAALAAISSPATVHNTAQAVDTASTSVQSHHAACTSKHWKRTMTYDEVWIATRESGMNPTPSDVNRSSGARELGQLLPSTEAGIHVTPTWMPCGEIHNMRVYIHERYGNEGNAVAFWRAHSWY